MTEEIIIDGIDVAGCEYYYEMDDCDGCHQLCNNATDIKNEYCEHYKDCYYKQLKRLEQENFALTQESQQKSQTICDLEQENEELKEENIKVKKEFNNLIVEIISDVEFTGEIASNGETPIEHLHKCQKALKTLEEIKEIAYGGADVNDCTFCYDIYNKINKILN